MDNIRALEDFLKKVREDVVDKTGNLNKALEAVGIRPKNCDEALKVIDKQIESARNKFTIAFVGTFNTGKSTIINSLLDLRGEARLSSEYDPDTARSIRLLGKEGQAWEAEVDFGGEYPTEALSWKDAKRYTSQVALDQADEAFRKRAEAVREVRYYLDAPLLRQCNILDLPGTGAGGHGLHQKVTNEKILESDCFFWVLPTDAEPDPTALANLQKIQHKLFPLINVWRYEQEGIAGDLTPDEIMNFVREEYPEYLRNAGEPIVYYAKEIDAAQQKGRELNPDWGKEKFVNKVEEIISSVHKGDRAGRISYNLRNALKNCEEMVNDAKEDPGLREIETAIKQNEAQNTKLEGKLERVRTGAWEEIEETAKNSADEALQIVSDLAENFIRKKMSGTSLRALPKAFTKKQQKELEKELRTEFQEQCLGSGWMEASAAEYRDKVVNLLRGKYSDFAVSLTEEETEGEAAGVDSQDWAVFVNDIADQIQIDFQDKLVELLSKCVITGLLLAIPGLNLLDSVGGYLALGKGVEAFANHKKLESKADMVVSKARVQIRGQRYSFIREYKKLGKETEKIFYNRASKKLGEEGNRISENRKKLQCVQEAADEFTRMLQLAEKERLELIQA